jgi:hypothetical protein
MSVHSEARGAVGTIIWSSRDTRHDLVRVTMLGNLVRMSLDVRYFIGMNMRDSAAHTSMRKQ